MKSSTDIVKIFAISNQLLEHDLDRVEADFGIDLGRRTVSSLDRDEAYYPQFDARIREEAARMAEHYEIFYCLEKTIRVMIKEDMTSVAGVNWWSSSRIPNLIQAEVQKRIQREIDSAATLRSTDPLDFTTFGELGEIIKSNWDIFGSSLNSQKALEKVMANLNTLRGPIAHCSPLAEDEVLRLQLSLRDWFRLME